MGATTTRAAALAAALIAAGAAAAGGCANTMNGRVDGEGVGPARSAVFDSISGDLPLLGEFHYLVLVLTGVPDYCEVQDELADLIGEPCDEACAGLGDVAARHFNHDHYWQLTIQLVSDGDPADEYAYSDLPYDGILDGSDEFSAAIARWDTAAAYDQAACEDECGDGDDLLLDDHDAGEDGTLEVTGFAEGDTVEGSYHVEFGAGDEVDGRFSAEHCDLGLDAWWPF